MEGRKTYSYGFSTHMDNDIECEGFVLYSCVCAQSSREDLINCGQ